MVLWIIIAAAVIAADRITKALTVSRLALGESVDVIPGVFRFTYVQNRGAAFGMLSNHRWVFILFSAVAIVGIIVYVILKKPKDKLLMTALSLIVGGGIGNMIDRIGTGYVVDFLDFCLFPNLWKWVFNVADAAACIGAALLVLYFIADTVKESKKAKAQAAGQKSEKNDDLV